MSTIEDRLSAALEARAEQVQPEDLRPADVPAQRASVTWLRHPATYVAAAAACAAVIATPFLMNAGDGGSEPSPAPSVVPSERPAQEDVGGDWPIEFPSDPVDVDGDGVKDQLRLRQEPGEPLVGPQVRIEVDLSATGDSVFGVFASLGSLVNVAYAADLDADGDRELVVFRDRGLNLPHAVLALRDGRLVEVEQPDAPLLVTGNIPAEGGTDRDSRVWTKGGALYSYLSVDSFSGGEPLDLPLVYPVEVTQWTLEGDVLVPREVARQCVDNRSTDPTTYDGLPVPCLDVDGTA